MNNNVGRQSRDRRQFTRLAIAAAGAGVFLVRSTRQSQAAGRHSDPSSCGFDDDDACNCLLIGTRIETSEGLVAVEDLKRGDLVRTDRGVLKRIKWVSRSFYQRSSQRATWSQEVDPVRVAKSAIAPGVPAQDTFLSPEHAILLGGALIPVKYLINGESIAQGHFRGAMLEYFHIECETHEVIFANGLPVETLLGFSDREHFTAFADYLREFGVHQRAMQPYAPILGYHGGRQEAKALLRSLVSNFVDIRDPIQKAYDRILEGVQH